MKSRVLLKTLESVSLKTKSGSKTIALYNFFLSNEPDGSFSNWCRSQELGLDTSSNVVQGARSRHPWI